jgi:molybdopterin synthase catalytic subunit
VLFFGILKDLAGKREDCLEISEGGKLADVLTEYGRRFPRIAGMAGSIVLARNQQFAAPSTPLAEGDEVALLPPVSGGSVQEIVDPEGHFFALTRDAIDSKALAARLLRGEDGAVVDFQGVARNNTHGRPTLYLDYECYEPMALKVMAGIGREIACSHPIGRIAMVHRLGRIEIGETSVAVVVSAPHRKPAFEAALEGIDRLKRTVPIWKKEHFEDGAVWVDGEWDPNVR